LRRYKGRKSAGVVVHFAAAVYNSSCLPALNGETPDLAVTQTFMALMA
jgi:hypothetical protein